MSRRSTVLAFNEPGIAKKFLLCFKTITNKSTKLKSLTENSCQKCINDAKRCSELNSYSRNNSFKFTNIYQRVFDKDLYDSVSFFTAFFRSNILSKRCT